MNLPRKIRSIALFEQLGPGLVTGAADDDPSGIATYSQTGARLVVLLFAANTVNIGADLAAMGASAELLARRGSHWFTAGFAIASLLLQMFIPYRRYVRFLKWLTLVLFAYVAVVLIVKLDWSAALRGLVLPDLSSLRSTDAITTIVAIFGTTISPYLFFWQAAQEVEEVEHDAEAQPLRQAPQQAKTELSRIRIDTFFGMAVSNVIAIAIMIATAATLHARGVTQIATAADAAKALEPAAGPFAFLLFALGVIGTGLLAIPVLAGSAAYAVGETRGWACGLDNKPWEAVGFYAVIGVATLLGVGIDLAGFDPMKALFWSAVVNGVIAVPMMVMLMLIASRRDQMGRFVAGPTLKISGWTATAVMMLATAAMFIGMATEK